MSPKTTSIQRIVVPVEWKAADDGSGALEGYASTFGNVDLQGDVIAKGAFAMTIKAAKSERRMWPLLADHRASTASVLGSITDAREDRRGLRIRAEFSSAPSAQDVRVKMLEGHIDRMSIGYEPLAWEFVQDKDTSERVRVLKEIKLWEVSVVVFPANPEAVVSTVKEMLVDAAKAGHDAGDILVKAASGAAGELKYDRIEQDENSDDDNGDTLEDGSTRVEEDDNVSDDNDSESADEDKAADDDLEAKGAIAAHSTATSDATWDGPAQKAKLKNDAGAATYRKAYAWVDSSADPNVKDHYKFIHHFVSDAGVPGAASTIACSTGIGVLNGGRSGTTIPDADKRGVYNHLAKHLRDAGQTPPPLKSTDPDELVSKAQQAAKYLSDDAKLIAADAVIEGRDPAELADEVKLAGTEARLELLSEWVSDLGIDE